MDSRDSSPADTPPIGGRPGPPPTGAPPGPAWWPLPAPPRPTVSGGISTRCGGVSPPPWASLNCSTRTGDSPQRVATNVARLARATGVDFDVAARIALEHGIRVRCATRGGACGPGDALVTTRTGVTLALTVADCIPLYLVTPGALALAHCGWRGVRDGIVPAVLLALAQCDATPRDAWWAWIGPGIGPCCFYLPRRAASAFPSQHWQRHDETDPQRETRVDLAAIVRAALLEGGLRPRAVHSAAACTACRADLFYSHRRDRGRTGRMLAWIRS